MTVEICCGDFESLVAAAEGGTRRIELCSGLSEGGLTPSAGMIRAAADLGIESVNVLVRPRKGDFCYNSREVDLMCREISIAAAEGATGIVAGALTPDGDIDIDTTGRLRQAAGDLQFTFHRAFDLCNDPLKALEDLVALQCDTLLTSGQAQSAPLGTQ
ncbi:MAG: copper homeostasis protein CutC, partial [Muribaculaceae bacterium]|nr:copper homeostasis protein CutC [Muribaculaceae bacterium]